MEQPPSKPPSLGLRILSNVIALGVAAIVVGIVVWLGMFAYGFIRAAKEDKADYPGKTEFRAANSQIRDFNGQAGFGNTPETIRIATDFSLQMTQLRESQFKQVWRSKLAGPPGRFLSYCLLTSNTCVLLCHVPDLSSYDASARSSLASLSWKSAQTLLKDSGMPDTASLIVGLRGFANYGPIWEGTLTGNPRKTSDSTLEEKRLYPYFVGSDKAPPAPSKQK